jgi:hypothetical protein
MAMRNSSPKQSPKDVASKSKAARSAKRPNKQAGEKSDAALQPPENDRVQTASEDSFPASDPPSWTVTAP